MNTLLKNWRVALPIILVVLFTFVILLNGIKFGMDFRGGTLFQIHLAEKVQSADEMARVRATIEGRLDWTGLKDTRVSSWGDEFVVAEIAETDPATVEKLEGLLRRQGKFEVTIDQNIIFTGADIIIISRDPAKGYGFREESANSYAWVLPFTLTEKAARSFSNAAFHRCKITSYNATAGNQYDCDRTYFFIDRPVESVILMPIALYNSDKAALSAGNMLQSIPQNTKIDEILLNINAPNFTVDENLSSEQESELKSLVLTHRYAIIPPELNPKIKSALEDIGYTLKEISSPEGTPWTWHASGARQVISLSEDITNMDPYVANINDAKIFPDLIIRGFASSKTDAESRLSDLAILLESGSLPVAVDSVSKETISPLLGNEFLVGTLIIGIFALIAVTFVMYLRYRIAKLTAVNMAIVLCEVYLILGFSSLLGWSIDLAAVAGLLAVLGTGVGDQIVMMDEATKGSGEQAASLATRVRRAFFIVVASASTVIATMFPLILFGFGMSKLVGFAITTIMGVLVGVLITRPAFAEILRTLLAEKAA